MKHLVYASSFSLLALAGCGSDDPVASEQPVTQDAPMNDVANVDDGMAVPQQPDDSVQPPNVTPQPPTADPPITEDPDDTLMDPPAEEQAASIVDIAVASDDFTQLVAALQAANLVDALSGDGPFTVFAPTNAAFDAFEQDNPGVLAGLSPEELTSVLTYHVVSGSVMSTDLVNGALAETLQGGFIGVALNEGVMINDARVTTADIEASNGVIHVIDRLILPPSSDIVETAVNAGSFTKLAEALSAAELVETLQGEGPFTVFAPTDAAFEAFEEANPGVLQSLTTEQLTDILLYHVSSGWVGAADLSDGMRVPTQLAGAELIVDLNDGVRVNQSSVTQANIITNNGVIHVIDQILLPPTE